MPTRNRRTGKPWRARIRRHGKDMHLGYYDTYDEAAKVEEDMRRRWPDTRGWNVILRDRERGKFVA